MGNPKSVGLMPGPHAPKRTSMGTLSVVLLSCVACIYVAGRLWTTTRELHYVEREYTRLRGLQDQSRVGGAELPDTKFLTTPTEEELLREGVLHFSTRPNSGPGQILKGNDISSDLPIQSPDPQLLGQIDHLEAGMLSGWACSKGQLLRPLEVQIFVDNVRVGDALASVATPHHIVHRLCELDMHIAGDMGRTGLQQGVGFEFKLPELPQGRHEIRAFVKNLEGTAKQELNQSPLPFIESRSEPGREESLRRKDAIIRVRNAQISALWDEIHTKQPWRNALDQESMLDLPGDAQNASRALVVFGINTGIGARPRRDTLRKTWVPTGERMRDLERRGIYIRFVVGYSEQKGDSEDFRLQEEMKEFGDILRLDVVDSYDDLSKKTLKMFTVLPQKIDAYYYFKVDDDVAVNIDAMEAFLQERKNQGNLYLGCMKSGQVLTDRRYKWFEPEYWRFGDPAGEGGINYMRHASGQIYGMSGPIARYVGRNAPILHRYANEDVTVGSWLVGLDVAHVDEPRFCCDSAAKCKAQSSESNLCLSYYERECAGICKSETRLEGIWNECLNHPLEKAKEAASQESSS